MVFASLSIAGCGGDDSEVAVTGSGGQLLATLNEWTVKLDVTKVSPGKVTISAKNTGTIEHELIVARSDAPLNGLITVDGQVPEDGIDMLGEISPFAPQKASSENFVLETGRYLLFCNLPAHYQQGMVAELTVG